MTRSIPAKPLSLALKVLLASAGLICTGSPAAGQAYDQGVSKMLLDCASANWVLGHLAKSENERDDYLKQGAAYMTSYAELTGSKVDIQADLMPRAKLLKATSPQDTAALFSTCIVVLEVGKVYRRGDRK